MLTVAGVLQYMEYFMADLFENPMGLCGFEFVEFASPTPNLLEPLFEKMGFSLVAKHRSKDVLLYRQRGLILLSIVSQIQKQCILLNCLNVLKIGYDAWLAYPILSFEVEV